MTSQTEPKTYPAGVPCWVEVLQPDPRAGAAFYRELFGWNAGEPGPMPDGGEYFVAQLGGDDVAGICTLPASGAHPAWTTYVAVDDVDAAAQRARDAGGSVVVAPFDAPPDGRLAILQDTAGATFGVWQPQARAGAQRINESSAWAMSALRTQDLDAANAFYGQVFGWRAEPFDTGTGRAVLYRLPGYVGGLPQQPVPRDVVAAALDVPDASPAHWSVDFWIDDVDTAVERVKRSGGSVAVAPFDAPPFRRAVVTDPAGATFTLSSH